MDNEEDEEKITKAAGELLRVQEETHTCLRLETETGHVALQAKVQRSVSNQRARIKTGWKGYLVARQFRVRIVEAAISLSHHLSAPHGHCISGVPASSS